MCIVVRKQYQVQASRRQTTVNKQNKHLLADAAAIFCRDAEILADIRLFILASGVTDCLRTTLLFFFSDGLRSVHPVLQPDAGLFQQNFILALRKAENGG